MKPGRLFPSPLVGEGSGERGRWRGEQSLRLSRLEAWFWRQRSFVAPLPNPSPTPEGRGALNERETSAAPSNEQNTMSLTIAPFANDPAHGNFCRGYKAFYETETSAAEYEQTWSRLMASKEVHGLGATLDGQLVGMAHYLFHTTLWAPKACYLQDSTPPPSSWTWRGATPHRCGGSTRQGRRRIALLLDHA